MLQYAAGSEGTLAITPQWQELIVGAVAFSLVCFVLMKFVFPRMEQMLQARTEAIEGGIKRAEATRSEAGQLLEQYRAQIAEARDEARRIRDDARVDAERIRQSALADAQVEVERAVSAARELLAGERQAVARELRAEVGALAVELAGTIVGESLAEEARRACTVERFLAEREAVSTS
ncbi:ATP synthase F0 subcomplex B subunit [Micromonospora pisi]|uniref:ATP synthase subunit b n=1 Tax=Micromonospora pisi TaxID=589240 RepID=A0A495JEQ5_9ACTN|nr:F0F1 ATP synthase subunit B [Micromonospora pisi]RKR87395.1 ATP synthase F0 subcomplex B subunit [Micromonospora pisi]